MLNHQTRLQPNEKEVAAKIMDGEAIMINLSTGVYHSMSKVGALVWELIERRYSLEEIVKTITATFDVFAGEVQADVESLVAELMQENLVSVLDQGTPIELNQRPAVSGDSHYESPKLNTYRDMGDMLALDPPMPKLDDVPWKNRTDEP